MRAKNDKGEEENMSKPPLTAEQKRVTESYPLGYTMNQKLLRLAKYESDFFGGGNKGEGVMPSEAPLARARMYEVRHFIMSLCNCDKKLFLYYRYVKSETVEHCAEMLGISRASGFRMRKRALLWAYKALYEKNDDEVR